MKFGFLVGFWVLQNFVSCKIHHFSSKKLRIVFLLSEHCQNRIFAKNGYAEKMRARKLVVKKRIVGMATCFFINSIFFDEKAANRFLRNSENRQHRIFREKRLCGKDARSEARGVDANFRLGANCLDQVLAVFTFLNNK